jgi:hypothetical protein
MPFTYKLEALLRLQRSVELQEENRLRAHAAIVARLRSGMNELEQLLAQNDQRVEEECKIKLPGGVLQMFVESRTRLQKRMRELVREIAAAENLRLRQLVVYRQAHQKRETLQGLKDRQEESYDLEQLRKLQQITDEVFLMRKEFQKNS